MLSSVFTLHSPHSSNDTLLLTNKTISNIHDPLSLIRIACKRVAWVRILTSIYTAPQWLYSWGQYTPCPSNHYLPMVLQGVLGPGVPPGSMEMYWLILCMSCGENHCSGELTNARITYWPVNNFNLYISPFSSSGILSSLSSEVFPDLRVSCKMFIAILYLFFLYYYNTIWQDAQSNILYTTKVQDVEL